jgi:hypothetical protein
VGVVPWESVRALVACFVGVRGHAAVIAVPTGAVQAAMPRLRDQAVNAQVGHRLRDKVVSVDATSIRTGPVKPEFRPSLAVPLRAVQCRAPVQSTDEAGRRCRKRAIIGALVCRSRGAQLPAVQQAAARTVDDAGLRLLLATEDAVVVLETLMNERQNEASSCVPLWKSWTGRAPWRSGDPPAATSGVTRWELQRRLATLSRRMSEARERELPISD